MLKQPIIYWDQKGIVVKIRWKKNRNFKPDHILDKIEKAKNISSDGRVSYSSFEYHNSFAAIFSMIDFPAVVKEELNLDSIVSKALGKAAVAGAITKELFIEKLNEVVKDELATKEEEYVLLTSFSMCGELPFKRIKIGKTSIRLTEKYPDKYSSRTETITKSDVNLSSEHDGYIKVIATTKSKSIHGACAKSLRDIDIIRALMCLFSNSSMELFGMNSPRPINCVRLGQTHTLHKKSGVSATNGTVWFEQSFIETRPFQTQHSKTLNKNIRWAIEQLATCRYGEALKDSLVRYVAALDEVNHTTALTKIWGALECIAAPSEGNYDSVTRRCSYIFEEYQYHRQVLEHLREFRNQSIHAGGGSDRAKTYCYQMQFYYRELLLFHLRSFQDFDDLAQANSFLDLPTDSDSLLTRQRLLKKALWFRRINEE